MSLSVSKYKYLLNNISDAILLESVQRTVLFVNQQFCQLFKIPLPPEHLEGFDCVAAAKQSAPLFKYPDKFLSNISLIMESGHPMINEFIELADGSFFLRDYIPVEENGEHVGHLWIYKNRTGEYNLKKEVTNQEEFYKNILDNLPADVALFSPQHKYLFVNRNGISNDEIREWIINKDDYDYARLKNLPLLQAKSRKKLFEEAINTGETVEFEEVSIRSDGEPIFNLRRFYPLKNERDEVFLVVGYGINISNIKQKQRQLEKSEYNFRNLLNSLNEVVLTIDKNFQITYVNPAWEQIMGFTVNETRQQMLSSFFDDEAFKKIALLIYEYQTGFVKTRPSTKLSIINRQGVRKHLHITISQQHQSISEETQIMVFIADITEQVLAEEQYKKTAQKEKNLNELKSAFIRMVSHELRTPLAIIQTTVDVMDMYAHQGKLNPASITKDCVSIQEEIVRMTDIMRELLDVSQIESQKVVIKPQLLSPKKLVKEILAKKFLPWKDGRMPQIIFKGYKGKLGIDAFATSRVLTNITENAFKYSTRNSKVILHIRTTRNGWSVLCVDEGIGILEKDMPKLFTSFKRGTNTSNIPGTGMGLVITKYFLESLQGTVQIKSKVNKGTCVYITFPSLPVVALF